MIEIRGADAYFLWEESRARHMHTIKVIVVEPPASGERQTFERVRQGALARLPELPAFRRRAIGTPLGIGHPFWLEAPDLDSDYHVRHEVLPPGSGLGGLDELVGRIASEPLDRSQPLWQMFFVEGLPDGRFAYVTKIHHAVADGAASAALVLRFFDEPMRNALRESWRGRNEAEPPAMRRFARALRSSLARQRELPGLLAGSLRAIRARRKSSGPVLRPFQSPPTRFNRPLTANRVFAHTTLNLACLRDVKDAFGCTLNDVYLALVGGALRGYLGAHEELPATALSSAVPVSVRGPGDDPTFGNATDYWFVSTGSDLADPVQRLAAVAASARSARALFDARDPRLAMDWFDHWPLRRLYLNGLAVVGRALLGRPSYNVIVSNVRGPAQPLYAGNGGRVAALYSMGPLSLQQGLNFTAWSYLDAFTVGVHACREHVPDVRALADALPVELEKLSRRARSSRQAGAA